LSDIFLSYSSKDLDAAKRLAGVLEASGLTVWWDRAIKPGKTFDQVIEEALEEASWAVVLWSANSVESNWVKAEAEEAARRGNLVPVLIEDVRPPLAFRRIEAAQLQDWDGDPEDHEYRQLVEVLGGTPAPAAAERPARRSASAPEPAPVSGSKPSMSLGAKLAIGLGVPAVLLLAFLGARSGSGSGAAVEPAPYVAPEAESRRPVKPVEQPPPARERAAPTAAITLQYLGDPYGCELDLAIAVGDQRVTPTSNRVIMKGLSVGPARFTVRGEIVCLTVGSCTAAGSGRLDVYDGAVYNLIWENTTPGGCSVIFAPG